MRSLVDVVKMDEKVDDFLYIHENFLYYITPYDKIERITYNEKKIGNLKHLISDRIHKVLVIVNPVGGAGYASKTWRILRPHFERRYKFVDEIFTKRSKHAYEVVRQIFHTPESVPDAIVCLGGDGLLSEVFNALFDAQKLNVPVFPIPCGSGNGLALSALAASPHDKLSIFAGSVRAAIHGRTQPLDLFQVEIGSRKLVAFLSVTMGLMADADIDSECCRCCGGFRFTVCGFWKIVKLKTYLTNIKISTEKQGDEEISGFFTHVSFFNVSHASADFVAAPERKLHDGLLSAVAVLRGDASRTDLVRAMSAAETGSQAKACPWWRSTNVTAFEITHTDGGDGFVVDGEFYHGKTLKASVISQVAHIYAP